MFPSIIYIYSTSEYGIPEQYYLFWFVRFLCSYWYNLFVCFVFFFFFFFFFEGNNIWMWLIDFLASIPEKCICLKISVCVCVCTYKHRHRKKKVVNYSAIFNIDFEKKFLHSVKNRQQFIDYNEICIFIILAR